MELVEQEGDIDAQSTSADRQCHVCDKRFKYPSQLRLHLSVHSKARPFPCDQCGRTFKYASSLDEHAKTHDEAQPFECDICGRRFAYRGNYRAHAAVHLNKEERERKFQCNRCPAAYFHRSHLLEHTRAQHMLAVVKSQPEADESEEESDTEVAEAGMFNCSVCGMFYKYRNSLLEHLRGHKKLRRLNKPLKCAVCRQTFEDAFKLRQHTEIDADNLDNADAAEPNTRRHRCCKCGRTFSRRCYLAQHAAGAHGPKRRHACDACGKCFGSKKCLRQHQAWVHSDDSEQNCAECGLAIRGGNAGMRAHVARHAKNQQQLDEHEEQDEADEALQTRKRKKRNEEKRKEKRQQQQRKTETKRFRCDLCDKRFPRLYNLMRHQQKMHDQLAGDDALRDAKRPPETPGRFPCPNCAQVFNWARNLKSHLATAHSEGERNSGAESESFKCSLCDKTFASQARLNMHARSHSGARPFHCYSCGCSYKHKKNLLAHASRCLGSSGVREDENDQASATSESMSNDEDEQE